MSTGQDQWDVAVIGSGLSGLTAAAYLATNGIKPLVLEQYDVAGGCSQTFRRKKQWQFDVGLHYIGGVIDGDIARVLRGVGLDGRVEFTELDPDGFDTFVFPDFTFRMPKGWTEYTNRLVETFPDEETSLREITRIMETVVKEVRAAGIPERDFETFARLAPTFMEWGLKSLTELFAAFTVSERAQAVLTGQAGDYATPPSRTPVILHSGLIDHYLQEGAFYVKGGGQALAGHLVDVIHTNGGRVRTHARVEQIEATNGAVEAVTLEGGERIPVASVIATGDLKHTFNELLAPGVVPDETREIINGYRMATPLVTVYLGVDFDITERMPATNFWIHPRYDSETYYEFVKAGEFDPQTPIYISSASAKDPGNTHHAPAGCSTLELMTWATPSLEAWGVQDESEAGRYSKQESYRKVKDDITERLIKGAEQVLGDLEPHILWKEAATPVTQTRYTLSAEGSSYGIELATDQIGPLRPGVRTSVEGLYLAGVSTRRGHGIVGAMLGGRDAAGALLDRNLQEEVNDGAVFGDPSRLTAGGEGWDALEACRKLQDKSARQQTLAAD
ncbi:MAG: NAD(P)/FAD-dependent oxidoreductase [Solirubrobacterales bacterium]